MENIKVKVNNEAESREVQGLLFELDYKWIDIGAFYYKISSSFNYITAYYKGKTLAQGYGLDAEKELTIPQLRDLVVLKRNDVRDANHIRPRDGKRYFVNSDKTRSYYMMDEEWTLTKWDEDQLHKQLKPIEKDMGVLVKEFLDKDYVLRLVKQTGGDNRVPTGWIEVPQGAEVATKANTGIRFWRDEGSLWWDEENTKWRKYLNLQHHLENCDHEVVWQRPQKPEALPFVDDEPKAKVSIGNQELTGVPNSDLPDIEHMNGCAIGKTQSLNDQYAEIEQVRQEAHPVGICIPKENPNSLRNLKDNGFIADVAISDFKNKDHGKEFDDFDLISDSVNHPNHYTQGGIECINALEAATVGKKGIEAVCVANVMKYLWRYEEKNGIEDVKKARWYLDRLISHLD